MANFQAFQGVIVMINDFGEGSGGSQGCYQMVSVENREGMLVNFIVGPETYVVDHQMLQMGDYVTGFYDVNAPAPLIYPPQYQARVMAVDMPGRNIAVDYFNRQLMSNDGMIHLNISPQTTILLENGQQFTGRLANRNLIVSYGRATKSIPAQVTPSEIVVMC